MLKCNNKPRSLFVTLFDDVLWNSTTQHSTEIKEQFSQIFQFVVIVHPDKTDHMQKKKK